MTDSNVIHILDTTLRDGDQGTGTPFMQNEKILVARKLAESGINVIEAGFARSRIDMDSIKEVVKTIGTTQESPVITSLSRSNRQDIDASFDALQGAKHPRIHTFIATSQAHIQNKLRMTPAQVIANIKDSVSYAASTAMQVQWSAEDAINSEKKFLIEAIKTAIQSGATIINIPDTLGGSNPWFIENLFQFISEETKSLREKYSFIISAHMHNDNGLALANTIAAIRGGARQVETTVLGIGERTGNVSLHQIAAYLGENEIISKNGGILTTTLDKSQIFHVSLLVSRILGMSIKPNEPIIGSRTNSHGSGIHSDGAIKGNKETGVDIYSIIDTHKYGNPGEIKTFNARGGRAEIIEMLGLYIDATVVKHEVIEQLVTKCAKMAEFSRGIYPSLVYAYYLEIIGEFGICDIKISGTHQVEIIIQIHGSKVSLKGESDLENGIIAATMDAINTFIGKRENHINLLHFHAEDRIASADLEKEFFTQDDPYKEIQGEKAIGIVTFDLEDKYKKHICTRFSSQNIDEASIKALIYGSIYELVNN